MTYEEHLKEFAGYPVVFFPKSPDEPLPATEGPCAWHLATFVDYDDYDHLVPFADLVADFLGRVDTSQVAALVIGAWDETADEGSPVQVVADAAPHLPNLRALFYGDILREQSDVAYIGHPPLTPLLDAFPNLEELWVRGGSESDTTLLDPVRHERLRILGFQSGGLEAATLRAVGECELPALEHLEFYFGNPEYGGDGTPEDVAWLLAGDSLPLLRRLGLRNSVIQDEIAAAVAHAPVVARLDHLDLSLGALTDDGAAALLAGQPLTHLSVLDLHHHFLSEAMAERLAAAWPGVSVDVSEGKQASTWQRSDGSVETYRYIAVNE